MEIVYVGLDLGSSNFQQVALNHDGVSRVNRDFQTSEANLIKAFSDLKGEIRVHLEAGGQRKIVSTLRAIWLNRTPYCEELMR